MSHKQPIESISIPARMLLALLRFYQFAVSPTLHGVLRTLSPVATDCRYLPTCSEYARQAIEIHGAFHGTCLAVARVLRCHPFTRGGTDPVPLPPQFPPHHLP